MASCAPLQNAQPTGAKLPANMRISPTYGVPILLSPIYNFILLRAPAPAHKPYCTTRLKPVVAEAPVLLAVTVTAYVPVGVPGSEVDCGDAVPQPVIARRQRKPSR